ncbi:hypothetical protein KGQ20_18590 [Catenulispora sp. NF23]|uniref:DUF4332 domain-containing protein n=1 Tax=Catenulispora pinistramenti TaxID=2705254 RepID=A0ABS5KZC4_9ACTN|nr:hypothetical protein [Catenulispora pinistramenti]MBS2534782.1 hypothetical protein [Catenulispora pinistramenti]MBS2551393.1 hypothetical protein [Catenulispora pinistramenti]
MAHTPADITGLLDGLGSADLAALAAAGFRIEELRTLAATPYGASQVEAVLACHTSAVGREPTDVERATAQTAFRRIGHGPRPEGARDMQAERAAAKTKPRPAGGPGGGKTRPERSPVGAWGTAFAVLVVAVAVTLVVAMYVGRPAALGVGFLGLLAIGGTAIRFPNSTRSGVNIAAGLTVAGLVALVVAAVGGPALGLRYNGKQASATTVTASAHTSSHGGGRTLECAVQAPDGKTVDLKSCPDSVTNVGSSTVAAFSYVYDPNGHSDPALGAKSDQGTGSQYALIAAIVVAAALAGLGIARSRPQS